MVNSEYVLKRTAQAVITLLTVITLSFAMIRLMPGGPVAYLKAQYATSGRAYSPEEIQRKVELYTSINPDKPIPQAYVDFVVGLLTRGDLGTSIWKNEPVIDVIADAMPWTIFLSAVSLIFIFSIAIVLGAIMAYSEGSLFDTGSTVVSIVVTSIPFYVIAIVMVWFLGYQWHVFPTSGRVDPDIAPGFRLPYIISVLKHAMLPVASLVIAGFGARALSMRGNSIQVLGSDYLRVARLRGLPQRRIALRYVGRNAILPMYTGIMIAVGTLFGGSIILEQIFSYRGLGYVVYRSIGPRDYPLLMGGFLFITVGIVIGVYIADLTYGWVDPRAGSGGDNESF